MNRVQSTGRVSAGGTASVSLTFVTPPAVGSAIVVMAAIYHTPNTGTICVDNRGNTYVNALGPGTSPAMWYCPIVTASGAPFTVTLSVFSIPPGYFEAAAIEFSGVGSTGLVIDKKSYTPGVSGTLLSSGVTVALTANEVILAAACNINTNQTSLVVQSASPVWTQEFENLNYSASIAGEGNTRIITGATGTTQECSWTASVSGTWGAAIVAFKATGTESEIPISGIAQAIPLAVPTQIAQNVIYALPTRSYLVTASLACEVSQTLTGPWIPLTNSFLSAAFIRCPTGSALITCKARKR